MGNMEMTAAEVRTRYETICEYAGGRRRALAAELVIEMAKSAPGMPARELAAKANEIAAMIYPDPSLVEQPADSCAAEAPASPTPA